MDGANRHLNEHGTDTANLHIITNYQIVLTWFRTYRNADTFPNKSKLRSPKSKIPYFLSCNPEVSGQIIAYCKENLSTISTESIYCHIHDSIIPNLVQAIQNDRDSISYSRSDLFKEFRLKKLTLATVYNWMKHLGFRYERRRKCYYVDNHEKPANIQYRIEFIKRYFAYELRCYRWIQISADEQNRMVLKGLLDKMMGHKYKHEGKIMYEFHCDDHIEFQKHCNTLPYGGYLSV